MLAPGHHQPVEFAMLFKESGAVRFANLRFLHSFSPPFHEDSLPVSFSPSAVLAHELTNVLRIQLSDEERVVDLFDTEVREFLRRSRRGDFHSVVFDIFEWLIRFFDTSGLFAALSAGDRERFDRFRTIVAKERIRYAGLVVAQLSVGSLKKGTGRKIKATTPQRRRYPHKMPS